MNKKVGIVLAVGLVVAVVVVGRSFNNETQTTIETYTDGLDTREIVEKMENDLDEDFVGAVWPDRIELEDGGEVVVFEDSKDMFYVSIAPYINTTHE